MSSLVRWNLTLAALVGVAGCLGSPLMAQTAAEIADRLANPNTSLGSLAFPIDFINYGGSLPDAGGQNAWKVSAQPSLPYPVAEGVNFFLRPLIPVIIAQPVPVAGEFEHRGVALGDIGYDAVIGKTFASGLILMGGVAGLMPTATDSVLGLHQWLFGPNGLVGYKPGWGFLGLLVSQQWRIAGSNEASTSITSGQYFYTIDLGGGWQIQSQPVWSYNHDAPDGDELTLPLGTGIARTVILGRTPLKTAVQYWYYVARPDPFGPRHHVRLQIAPVIPLPWGG